MTLLPVLFLWMLAHGPFFKCNTNLDYSKVLQDCFKNQVVYKLQSWKIKRCFKKGNVTFAVSLILLLGYKMLWRMEIKAHFQSFLMYLYPLPKWGVLTVIKNS